MIDENTLYYTFSTIPQILGAMTALLVAFVHFRLLRLEDYLIGDGQSIINRIGDKGVILNKQQEKRLVDAVARKNIYEIKAVLKGLSEKEKEEGYTKAQRPTGLQYCFEDRFCGTLGKISDLKKLTLISTGVAMFTIIFSLGSLSIVDCIRKSTICSKLFLIFNVSLTIITLILAFWVIYKGLVGKTLHETDRE